MRFPCPYGDIGSGDAEVINLCTHLLPEVTPELVQFGLPLLYPRRLRMFNVHELASQLVYDSHAGRVGVHLLVEPVVSATE